MDHEYDWSENEAMEDEETQRWADAPAIVPVIGPPPRTADDVAFPEALPPRAIWHDTGRMFGHSAYPQGYRRKRF
jgi:hypothetical protein